MNFPPYTSQPQSTLQGPRRQIASFGARGHNRDPRVIDGFGEEWKSFHDFDLNTIDQLSAEYFDILPIDLLSANTSVLDVGCGSGRFSEFVSRTSGRVEAVDPSEAVFAADQLLKRENVRITQCDLESMPFAEQSFDLVMSVGVLHHVPDTAEAILTASKYVKPEGYLYLYLYYNLEDRGALYRGLFWCVDRVRRVISQMPLGVRKSMCAFIAATVYYPLARLSKIASTFSGIGKKLPLAYYADKSFYIMKNDALDRFGTRIEHRFSRHQITQMLQAAGMKDIRFSSGAPFYHVIARR